MLQNDDVPSMVVLHVMATAIYGNQRGVGIRLEYDNWAIISVIATVNAICSAFPVRSWCVAKYYGMSRLIREITQYEISAPHAVINACSLNGNVQLRILRTQECVDKHAVIVNVDGWQIVQPYWQQGTIIQSVSCKFRPFLQDCGG